MQAVPAKTLLATLIAAFLAGCSSSGSVAPSVANPFASGGDDGRVQVNTLRTFGDSYTDVAWTSYSGTINWVEKFKADGYAAKAENYAIGGARAMHGGYRSLFQQITNWKTANSPVTDRDLTVIYMGHNDIGRNGNSGGLERSTVGYKDSVAALVDAGATQGNNRLFVTLLHDWSKGPGVVDSAAPQVIEWNNIVRGIGNSTPNAIVVDMYTVFQRIFEDPNRYGFVSTTKADRNRSGIDHLYHDATHLGNRGQEIIARVYEYYLTRGWNWASQLTAGAKTVAQLNKDIDNGTLVLGLANQRSAGNGLRLLALGTSDDNGLTSFGQRRQRNVFRLDEPSSSGFQSQAPRGVALDFGGNGSNAGSGQSSRMGLAFLQYGQDGRISIDNPSDRSSTTRNSNATAFYWHQPYGGLTFSTQVARIDHEDSNRSGDDILQLNTLNRSAGQSWSFEQKIRKGLAWQGATITPWVSLGAQRHEMASATLSSVYTGDVRFSSGAHQYWMAGLGMDVQSPVIALDGGHKLQLGGSLMHRSSLSSPSVQVFMQEAANQIVQSEVFDQGRIRQTYLGLNADMQLSSGWRLRANYTTDLQKASDTSAVTFLANFSF